MTKQNQFLMLVYLEAFRIDRVGDSAEAVHFVPDASNVRSSAIHADPHKAALSFLAKAMRKKD
jgi:hypothetical protein